MITEWTWPAYVALLLGTGLFAALFVPILAWQYLSYGRLSLPRIAGSAAAAVYGVALIAYTLLPLPESDWCRTHEAADHNLRPFAFVGDIRAQLDHHSLGQVLAGFVFLQVAFNVVLFIPWGVLARRLAGLGIVAATASGLAVSLLIESTQGTGAFGLVGCAYRVADVDDIITNTTGALIGAVVAPILLGWMPSSDALRAGRSLPRPVTRRRRMFGMLIDASAFLALAVVISVGYRAWILYALNEPLPTEADWFNQAIPYTVSLLIVIVLPALVGSGASLGQRVVRLSPQYEHGGRWWRRPVRLASGVGLWATLTALASYPPLIASGTDHPLDALSNLLALASIVAVVVDRSARGLSYRLAGAHVVDSREQ